MSCHGAEPPDNGQVRRIAVVGNSGSGKTTLAARLAEALGVPRLELDAVFHQPGWQPLPKAEFRSAVSEFARADAWVIDGNYSAVSDIVWSRADTVVWLDPPRRRVMRQLAWRTLRRAALGTELWNGNRERWRDMLSADPEKSIIRWAWTRDHVYRERYLQASADPAHAHLEFIRLRTRAQATALIDCAARTRQAEPPVSPPPARRSAPPRPESG
jgi:adenylate kinase family enzyme